MKTNQFLLFPCHHSIFSAGVLN